jgi:hypothetical protein
MPRTGVVNAELTREEYRMLVSALSWEIAHWQERARLFEPGTESYQRASTRALEATALRHRLRRIGNGPGFLNVSKKKRVVPEPIPVIDGDLE